MHHPPPISIHLLLGELEHLVEHNDEVRNEIVILLNEEHRSRVVPCHLQVVKHVVYLQERDKTRSIAESTEGGGPQMKSTGVNSRWPNTWFICICDTKLEALLKAEGGWLSSRAQALPEWCRLSCFKAQRRHDVNTNDANRTFLGLSDFQPLEAGTEVDLWGLIHTGRARRRKANGTCVPEWECSHCGQSTSKGLRSNLRARPV